MRATDVDTDYEPEQSTLAQSGIQPAEPDKALAKPDRELGYILDTDDEEKVAKHVIKLRTDQNAIRAKRRALWTCNRLWREGKRWIKVEKKQDASQWRVYIPPGMGSAPPLPNKTDRLCRRVVNTVLVDQPYPECEAAGNAAKDKEAAEFATRYLLVRGSASELNVALQIRRAANKSMHMASAFLWATMDPHGNGHRPRQMLAHPKATSADDPFTNPDDGLPASEDEITERFVRPDGALTDDPQDADYQWLPGHRIRLLTGLQVDLLPATCSGIADADGVLITYPTTLGELQAEFPDYFDGLGDTEEGQAKLEKLCSWRPPHVEDILPPYQKEPADQKYPEGHAKAGQYMPGQMVVVTAVYYRSCSSYAMGCYAVIGGDSMVLHKDKHTALMPQPEHEDGSDAPPKEECLMLPLAQIRCLNDDLTDDPMGTAMAEALGPSDEIRASAFGTELEHMFRAGNPIPLLPIGSIVQPGQLRQRNNEPVFFNPQGQPVWEQVPPLSQTVVDLRNEMTNEMNDESGLQEAAQGVENAQVKSGIHAQTIVQQALKAVMEIKDNLGDGYIRLNQIILQHARAYLTVPQLISFVGEDGEYKAQEFSRTDFGNTKVVTIQKGTFTMHTQAAKQEMATELKNAGAIDQFEFADLITSGTSPILGRDEHPALLRVRRQLTAFKDGPSPEWQQAMQAYQQQAQLFQQQQAQLQMQVSMEQQAVQQHTMATGVPMQAPPSQAQQALQMMQPPQKPAGPFDPRLPIDDEPTHARIRHRQLADAMAATSFGAYPPEWQNELTQAYLQDRNAAGVMTVPDVQRQKAQEAASMPPALPRGVTIAMKGDAATVADEERAAMQGFGGGKPQQAA